LGQGDIRAVALVDEVSARHLIGRTDLADVPCTCDEFPFRTGCAALPVVGETEHRGTSAWIA
jgi:hypothetical protein